MSTALQGALASRRGHPLAIIEKRRQEATRGHAAGTSLRGHSMDDDIFPWLVVGVGSGWEVWDVEGRVHARSEDVHQIHAEARALKILHPRGVIETARGGVLRNISGRLDSIPKRLAGLRFTVTYRDDEPRTYQARAQQRDGVQVAAFSVDDARMVGLNVHTLAVDHRYRVTLDERQFLREPQQITEE